MGLTKPRASQIYNLDYKQATRVVTVTNVTLTAGAPNQVDGVNLSAGDRILVAGQSTASQNGLYDVYTVGSGSNGSWVRTSDANATGEIDAGMIVMVTEGLLYADTQWKLITDNPIVIGTTSLIFTQNYSANSISGGTSNVTVYSNANVIISSAGTANVLTVSNTGAYVTGVVSATGNITGNYILGNGSQLTGLPATYSNANVATFLAAYGSNTVSTTGNITSGNLITSGLVSATGNVTSGNISTAGNVSATANVTGGNILTAGLVSATGNVTGNYFVGNGSQLTGISAGTPSSISSGTSNVSVASANGDVTISANGTPNVAVFSTGSLTLQGAVATPKTITSNVVIAPNINGMLIGPLVFGNGIGMTVPDSSVVYVYAP